MKTVDDYRHDTAPIANPLAPLPLTIQGVIHEILDRYKVKWRDVVSRKRPQRLSDARHLIAAFLCWHTNLTLVEIGIFLGARDHGTIIHSRRKIADLWKSDLKVRNLIDDLEERHLDIEDHVAIIRDRSENVTSSGFNLPEVAFKAQTRPDFGRPRTADGRRVMTAQEIRQENARARSI
jgi:hypothetical protein